MFAALDSCSVTVFIKRAWDSIKENVETAAKRVLVIMS
jgi:hypothetical protein